MGSQEKTFSYNHRTYYNPELHPRILGAVFFGRHNDFGRYNLDPVCPLYSYVFLGVVFREGYQMIYITQLVFVKNGKEAVFHKFEDFVIPLITKYNGRMMYRVRPAENSFVSALEERPYEIHIVSFDSEQDFQNFMRDDSRLNYIHLKDESVKSTVIVKGVKL